jgi:hypothetical protein
VSGQGSLTIDGGGAITISGGNSHRVLQVNSGADLTLRDLTVADGNANPGGGVLNDGTLTIIGSTFRNNTATFDGGGVRNNGTLTITNSTFQGNRADIGGGVENRGSLTVTGSLFSGNAATNAGGGVFIVGGASATLTNSRFTQNTTSSGGGGVANVGTLTLAHSSFSENTADLGGGVLNDGTLTVEHSSFVENTASLNGGGVVNFGTLTLVNSTLSGNSAGRDGGGLWSGRPFPMAPLPTLAVDNSTFSGNEASGSGGGIRIADGDATLRNTIVANSAGGGDCVGTLTGSNLNNLIEGTGASACGLVDNVDGNIVGQDPQLDPLFGTPAYHPLQLGSPAIDAGDPATCSSSPVSNQSQNGIPRPQDGDGDSVAVCDIGAYELAVSDMAVSVAAPGVLAPGGVYPGAVVVTCTNNGPAVATQASCGATASAGTLTLAGCSPAVPVGLLGAGGSIVCTYDYAAPGTVGGGDEPTTSVAIQGTTAADNENAPGNNTSTTSVPMLDAVDDAVSLPAGAVGASFHVGANDQLGAVSPPTGATYSLLAGTTCVGASISGAGVASFNVPLTGTCVVVYRVCVNGACDSAQLVVTGVFPPPRSIPALGREALWWLGLLALGLGLAALRRVG